MRLSKFISLFGGETVMLCATGQRLQEDFWVKMLRTRYKFSSGSFGSVQRGRVAGVLSTGRRKSSVGNGMANCSSITEC